MTTKQLEKLNTSDAIHDFKAYIEEDLQYFSQTELQNYPKDLNIRSLILTNDWEKAIEKYSHLNPTTE